jgi:hypothetical protein
MSIFKGKADVGAMGNSISSSIFDSMLTARLFLDSWNLFNDNNSRHFIDSD